MPLVLLLLAALAGPATVTVDLDTWRALQEAASPADLPPGPRPAHASHRSVTLIVAQDHVRVEATWRIQPGDTTWFAEPLLGPSARPESLLWDGRSARAHALRDGYVAVERLTGPVSVEAVATLAWDGSGVLPIHLFAATRGELRVEVDGPRRPQLTGHAVDLGGARFWTGSDRLGLSLVEESPDPPAILLGEIATGVTYGDGLVHGRARVRVVPRRGSLETIVLHHEGLGDVRVRGQDVASVTQEAGTIRVGLTRARESVVALELDWTRPTQAAEPLPILRLDDVVRTESWLQVARSGDDEVVPRAQGRRAARGDLPPWAARLVSGPVVATWGPEPVTSGSVTRAATRPEDTPVVVRVADYVAAVSPEGRVIVRGRYTVRSDGASFLRLTPPPGARLLAARVDGHDTPPLRMHDGTWRLPLRRSIASVGGPIAFPV